MIIGGAESCPVVESRPVIVVGICMYGIVPNAGDAPAFRSDKMTPVRTRHLFFVQTPSRTNYMTIENFLEKLRSAPESIAFSDTMAVIDAAYSFTAVAFTNGKLRNEAGQNTGSCKLLAFASLHGLNEQQTLACFGTYYRDDVLAHPHGQDHQNIRTFMESGWAGVRFEGQPLTAKQP